jgi:hypothetical protein
MIVVLVISIDFLMPKAAAPQPEFVTKIMHSPPALPEYREGTRQRARRRECTPHDHANKRSPKEIVPSFGSPSQLVDPELAQMSPQKSSSRRSLEDPEDLPEARFWMVADLEDPLVRGRVANS